MTNKTRNSSISQLDHIYGDSSTLTTLDFFELGNKRKTPLPVPQKIEGESDIMPSKLESNVIMVQNLYKLLPLSH